MTNSPSEQLDRYSNLLQELLTTPPTKADCHLTITELIDRAKGIVDDTDARTRSVTAHLESCERCAADLDDIIELASEWTTIHAARFAVSAAESDVSAIAADLGKADNDVAEPTVPADLNEVESLWDQISDEQLAAYECQPMPGLIARVSIRGRLYEARTVDLSRDGVRAVIPNTNVWIAENSEALVSFRRNTTFFFEGSPLVARVGNAYAWAGKTTCWLAFARPLSSEQRMPLSLDQSCSTEDLWTRRRARELQVALAEQDLATLESAHQRLEQRNWHLTWASVATLCVASMQYLLQIVTTVFHASEWSSLLPLAVGSSIVGLLLTHKLVTDRRSVRSYEAFSAVLRRGMEKGHLPPEYRGWEAASKTFDRHRRQRSIRSRMHRFLRMRAPIGFDLLATRRRRQRCDSDDARLDAFFHSALLFLLFVVIVYNVGALANRSWTHATEPCLVLVASFVYVGQLMKRFQETSCGSESFESLTMEFDEILRSRGDDHRQQRDPHQGAFGRLRRFANSLYAPGTPAGSWRNQA